MPLIEGESLRDRLNREKQLPVDESLEIIRTVAGALSFAHAQGVVHRDIKPENILLQHGQALVADFGIALAASLAGDSRLTEAGTTLGTPLYMCPEQALGEPNVDLRADVYAIAATLYEMLAGHPPFTAASAQGIIAKVISEPAPLIRRERPSIPEHVEAALRVALEKLPADRFSSAHAFSDALANPSFGTQRLTSTQLAGVGTRRRLERLAVPALGLAAVSLALAGWLAATRSARGTRHDASLQAFTAGAAVTHVPVRVTCGAVIGRHDVGVCRAEPAGRSAVGASPRPARGDRDSRHGRRRSSVLFARWQTGRFPERRKDGASRSITERRNRDHSCRVGGTSIRGFVGKRWDSLRRRYAGPRAIGAGRTARPERGIGPFRQGGRSQVAPGVAEWPRDTLHAAGDHGQQGI